MLWWPPQVKHLMIPARDGIKLSTVFVNPYPYDKPKPTLLSRSPYGPTSDQVTDIFLATGKYASVIQDQRGTFLSEGNFSMFKSDANDAYDTMHYLSQHPELFSWFNGDVFSLGISADGCSALTQIVAEPKPKWLKGEFVIWATGEAHDTAYPGGSFREGLVSSWMTAMIPLTAGESFATILQQLKQHEAESKYYEKVESEGKLNQADFPIVHLSGWWDIFNTEHVRLFKRLQQQSPVDVRNSHVLFVGPLGHCVTREATRLEWFHPIIKHELFGWVAAFEQAHLMFQSIQHEGSFDPGSNAYSKFKRINLFVQGAYPRGAELHQMSEEGMWQTDHLRSSSRMSRSLQQDSSALGWPWSKKEGNFWVALDEWLPEVETRFFLSSGFHLKENKLSGILPGKETFTYDPQDPSLTNGGNNFILDLLGFKCGSQDQVNVEKRKDNLVFTSDILGRDLSICGAVSADIYVSSDRNDTDLVVTLSDVYEVPSSIAKRKHEKSMLVSRGIQNLKWRYSKKEAVALKRNSVSEVHVDMGYTCYVFSKGHRVRVSITSSSWPFYAINKNSVSEKAIDFLNDEAIQSSEEIKGKFKYYSAVDEAEKSQGLVAKNTIYFSANEYPSAVTLPVVDLQELKNHRV